MQTTWPDLMPKMSNPLRRSQKSPTKGDREEAGPKTGGGGGRSLPTSTNGIGKARPVSGGGLSQKSPINGVGKAGPKSGGDGGERGLDSNAPPCPPQAWLSKFRARLGHAMERATQRRRKTTEAGPNCLVRPLASQGCPAHAKYPPIVGVRAPA